MKNHFLKKAAALALVLSLFVSLLSVAAATEGPGPEGDGPELPPGDTMAEGAGTEETETTSEVDALSGDTMAEDAGTEEEETEGPGTGEENASTPDNTQEPAAEGTLPEVQSVPSGCTNGGAHTPDLTQEVQTPAYTTCGGGYTEPVYSCTVCGATVNKDGANASWEQGTGAHTPGSEKHAADYTVCGGGYQTEYYLCTVCRRALNADGSEATFVRGTEAHTPGSEKHAATYTVCGGGVQTEWYLCIHCGYNVDVNGNPVTYIPGTGVHTPGSEKHAADYTTCNGGFQTDWYECTECGRPVNADGSEATFVKGTGVHTSGSGKHAPSYTSCNGGYQTEYYLCTVCGHCLKEDGSEAEWIEGNGAHTPGSKKYEPNYTPCSGGHKTDFYICTVCNNSVNADGSEAEWIEGNGAHTPGSKKYEPNYTPCGGGVKTDFYSCTVCGDTVNADGSRAEWIEGTDRHQTVSVPTQAPTTEEYGWLAHWECSVCGRHFANSEGTKSLDASFFLPTLPDSEKTQVVTEKLDVVPESIKNNYATVEAVQTALLDTAKAAGFDASQTNAGSVLLDVTLQVKNADGTLTPVSPDDFPAEGVTVVIPYPAGTDRSYTFVITHMITNGAQAGQIEVLRSINAENGIYVCFTSMSPVCISYMLEAGAPAPAVPAPAAPVVSSTVPKTSDAAHGAPWGMLALLSIGGLGALFAAGKKLRGF